MNAHPKSRVIVMCGVMVLFGVLLGTLRPVALVTGSEDPKERKADSKDVTIRPGSALDKLVKEAKTHPVMKLAAATTTNNKWKIRTDIPDWLRAHYMRNHPHVLTAAEAKDPTGGFPLALESLYAWMLRHQDLQASPVPKAIAAAAVEVGANTRISGPDDGTPRSESDIRINFNNPQQLIGASNNPANGAQAQFFSADGGATWGQTTLPLLAGDSLQSDPTVDWTSDGTAWATTIGIAAGSTSLQMRAYNSTDGGQTWNFDSTFSGDQTSADKQMMWVDRGSTSPHKDNIYVIWHNDRPAFINRRTSNGWQTPIQVSGNETTGTAIGSSITTNEKGDVFAVWPDTGSQTLFFVKSTNGGAKFSNPVPIAKTFGSFQIRVPAFAERAALIGVATAAFGDNVYVSYVDLAGGAGCDTPDSEPGNDVTSDCTSRVWFLSSPDGGATWTKPVQLNNAGKSDQFCQRLAVDPASGALGIVYYNTGKGADRTKTDLFFQVSSDKGKTWSSPVKVTTRMTDETAQNADTGNQYGDYNGLTVTKDTFFPSWTDRRDNRSEAIFTAKINLVKDQNGAVTPVVANKK
jgi:hypothetical protein